MDVHEIRFRNYRALLTQFQQRPDQRGEPERGLINRFGAFVEVSPRYLSHLNNRRKEIGDTTARKFEAAFKLPHGWMDHDHLAGPTSNNKPEREFVELALRLFRESPLEAQGVLLRYMADRVIGSQGNIGERKDEASGKRGPARPAIAYRARRMG